jgi:hypothetical protein
MAGSVTQTTMPKRKLGSNERIVTLFPQMTR